MKQKNMTFKPLYSQTRFKRGNSKWMEYAYVLHQTTSYSTAVLFMSSRLLSFNACDIVKQLNRWWGTVKWSQKNKSIKQNNSSARKLEENFKNRHVDVEYYRYSKLIFSFHSVVCFSCWLIVTQPSSLTSL